MSHFSRLRWKVIVTILAVGLVPVSGVLVWAVSYGKQIILMQAGERLTAQAHQAARQMDLMIEGQINEARNLARSDELIRTVTVLRRPAAGPAQDFVRSTQALMAHPASRYLQAYQDLHGDEYGAIVVTDRHGGLVASTHPLRMTQYGQEPWWQAAYNGGQGRVVAREASRQPGDNVPRLDLAVPIMGRDHREVLGVIRFVIRLHGIGALVGAVKSGTTGQAMVMRDDGQPVFSQVRSSASQPAVGLHWDAPASWTIADNGAGGTMVMASSSVSLTGIPELTGGITPWRIVVTQETNELFMPFHRTLWALVGLSATLIVLLAYLAVVAGRRLTQPMLDVRQGAEAMLETLAPHSPSRPRHVIRPAA